MTSTRQYGSAGAKASIGTAVDHAASQPDLDDGVIAAQAHQMPGGPGGGYGPQGPRPGGGSGNQGGFGDPDVPARGGAISYKGMKGGLGFLDSILGASNGGVIMSAMFALTMDALKNRSGARKEAFAEGMNKIAVAFGQACENMKLIDEQKSLAQEKYSNAMVGAWCQIIGGVAQAALGGVSMAPGVSSGTASGLNAIGSGTNMAMSGMNSFFQAQSAGAEANSSQWQTKKNVEKLNVRKAEADMASQQADQAKDDANEHLKSVKDLCQKIWASKVDNMKQNISR